MLVSYWYLIRQLKQQKARNWKRGARSQGTQWPLEAEKCPEVTARRKTEIWSYSPKKLNSANNLSEQQMDFPLEPPHGMFPADNLILAP